MPFLQCLPSDTRDPFGRPIVVLKLAQLLESPDEARPALIHYTELLRRNLEAINTERVRTSQECEIPILQYIALIDIGGMSVQSVVRPFGACCEVRHHNVPLGQSIDLITWFVYELIPRFPGMLGAGK